MRSGGDDALRLLAEPLDAEPHRLPRLQEHRLRLDAEADTRWRAGRDDVTRLQRDEVADVADDLADAEDHRLGRAVLIAMAVDFGPQTQLLRVLDLVLRHHPGAGRAERVA